MLGQRGFSSLLVFIAVTLVLVGFYLGRSSLETFVSPFISAILQTTPSPSPESSVDRINNIVATGDFQFSDHKIKYTFITPKTGGEVTGSLEGVCSGTPSGTYDGQSSIKGEFTARCSAGPLNLINVDLKMSYTGTVYPKDGKITIIWESTSPREQRGSFDLYFDGFEKPSTPTTPSNNTSDPNAPTSIKVLTPNGGESYKVGDTIPVTWSSNNLNKSGSCIVTLTYENGSTSTTWTPVNTPTGSYNWKVTQDSAGKQAKVNLECYDDKQTRVTDSSDNFFPIQ